MNSLWRPALALAVLAGAAMLALSALQLDYRIDAFLPAPENAQQALVVEQVNQGIGGRLILAAVSGGSPAELTRASRELARRWRQVPDVERVDNGELDIDSATAEAVMRTRFVLLPEIERLTGAEAMAGRLDNRLADLALGGRRAESIIRRDPLGMLEELAGRLGGVHGPETFDEVWFDSEDNRALLTVVSRPPSFAIAEQTALLSNLRAEFDNLSAPGLQLTLAGAPAIAVDSARAARADAVRLSLWGSLFLLAVLAWAWRSVSVMIAGAVPLATGVVCGLAVTALAFGQVHGLTLAFGFTLLGVVLDYPVHLFGHSSGGGPDTAVRTIRRPLLTGAISTFLAYTAIWVSTSPGLAQLGAFSAAGLAGAAAATLLLPKLRPGVPRRPPPQEPRMVSLPWAPAVLAAIALTVLVVDGEQRWSNDLSRLSPVNRDLVRADQRLRNALVAGDVRHLLAVSDASLESVLQATESSLGVLEKARERGLLSGWQAVTDFVPSQQRQRRRAAQWPDAATMAQRLHAAGTRFRGDAFGPFLDDLDTLGEVLPVTPETWQDTALAGRIETLLHRTDSGWRALIVPAGLSDADALAEFLERHATPAVLVDLRAGSEAMVAAYRRDAALSLGAAGLAIVALLIFRLGSLRLAGQVVLPPLAAVLCAAAVMSRFDDGLTIVHLVGLLLIAGIGLDFALFSRILSGNKRERAQTGRAIGICALSSGGVFFILGQSQIGMLRMLGLTVALGILLSWLFARLSQAPERSP